MIKVNRIVACMALLATVAVADTKPRARDIGIEPGILPPGTWNAITDVAGVKVGHMSYGDHPC